MLFGRTMKVKGRLKTGESIIQLEVLIVIS
jgi:hypothetical protein